MKFSLKTIAAAVVLASAAAGASAAIDTGANGNGTLFLNVWDANGSYSFNLNKSLDTFQSDVAAAGLIDQSYALTNFGSFLAGVANTSALKFNLLAADNSGARRLLTTFTAPVVAVANTNDKIRTAVGNVAGFAGALNTAMGANDNVAVNSASAAYAGKATMGNTIAGMLNFNTFGALSANSYASGLSFMRVDALATGVLKSTYTPYVDGTSDVKVYIDGANNLHIQAMPVPEPESYAMLLAGLGLMGFVARRRANKAA